MGIEVTIKTVSDAAGFWGWIEAHPGLAAWIQGIGSLIGLAAAIAVPLCIEKRKDRAEKRVLKLRAKAIAPLVLNELNEMESEILKCRPSEYITPQAWHDAAIESTKMVLLFAVTPRMESWSAFRSEIYTFGELGDAIVAVELSGMRLGRKLSPLLIRILDETTTQELWTWRSDVLAQLAAIKALRVKLEAI